jgi:uncharacterized protein DUF6602
LLKAHLDETEAALLATSRIPANAGHRLHRGTPREALIKQFLEGHVSSRVSIGTGEIIDAESRPRDARNQFDIVIYRNEFPRIDLGSGINAFLAESVVATIEVKSLLTEEELGKAVDAAHTAKCLKRNLVTSFTTGYQPPGILSYVVAYSGPAKMATVQAWLERKEHAAGLNANPLPPTGDARTRISSESIEGAFCLGLGSIVFDNSPISILDDKIRAANPIGRYTLFEQERGNLLWLFLLITQAMSGLTAQWANLVPYLSREQMAGKLAPR